MSNCCNNTHPDHSSQLTKLNRISGQIDGIKKMIDERRYCPDIMTQLKAIQAAAKAVESSMLKLHLESCVKDAFTSQDEQETQIKIEELIKLFKKN